MLPPTQRFSSRVEDYIRYRPGYPPQIVEMLRERVGLTPDWKVADIGSGPGNLTRLFLDNGNEVYGVEPNREMREAGERQLAAYERFHSVDGTAEATTLPSESIDLVVAGQAFHWFDQQFAHAEFERVLKPAGWVALVWNDRHTAASPFLADYDALLRAVSSEYSRANHSEVTDDDNVARFFAPAAMEVVHFPNQQVFDRTSLRGRVLSSSYVPHEGPEHEAIMRGVNDLYERYQQDGKVAFIYETQIFFGRINP